MRFRLRTLLIVVALGPPVLALALVYGDRPFIEFQRWLIRGKPGGQKVVMPPPISAPSDKLPNL